MKKIPIESLLEAFDEMPDPRIDRTKKHELVDILVIAICGTIAGAEGWVAVEEYGLSREQWFRTFLSLPNGIPSHGTFGRVFSMLDPKAFTRVFTARMAEVAELTLGEVEWAGAESALTLPSTPWASGESPLRWERAG